MALKSSRVVSSSSCPVTTTRPVTISCPAPRAVFPTEVFPTEVSPTAVSPTEVCPTNGVGVNALLAQLGLCPTAGEVSPVGEATCTPGQVFNNPFNKLGGGNPLAALFAINPAAALAALSPALGIFNQANNQNSGIQAGAPTLANKQGKCTNPFGKFFKKPFGI